MTAAGLQNAWLSHGLADEWVVDNGLEFHSFGFKSMAMSLGVDLTYSRVRTPWIKPHVERFFSTLNTLTLTKGRVHKRVANSMNVDPYKDAAICFSDLVQGLMQFFVDVFPFEVNWRKMARPYDLFKEGLERCLPAIYPGDLQQLKLASGMQKMLTFGHGGIEMEGLPYGSVDFKHLANRHGTGLKLLCKFDPDEVSKLYVQEPESLSWIEAQCRWKHYAEGLSYNQHRLIRKFGRAEFKSSDALENLLQAKLRLHEHWMTSTRAGKRADSLLAARFANLTSSRVIASDGRATPQIPPQLTPSENQLILPESGDVEIKDIPDFETLVM